MKGVSTVVALATLAASISLAQSGGQLPRQRPPIEQELRRLNEESANMQIEHDGAAARRLLADDYVFFQADGNVSNRAQNVAVIEDPAFVCESLVTDDVEVRVYGSVAVITGHAVMKATFRGKDVGGHFRYTDVWVRRQGRWQTVVSQATLIPQPQ